LTIREVPLSVESEIEEGRDKCEEGPDAGRYNLKTQRV
jgi:hypothetical protein